MLTLPPLTMGRLGGTAQEPRAESDRRQEYRREADEPRPTPPNWGQILAGLVITGLLAWLSVVWTGQVGDRKAFQEHLVWSAGEAGQLAETEHHVSDLKAQAEDTNRRVRNIEDLLLAMQAREQAKNRR